MKTSAKTPTTADPTLASAFEDLLVDLETAERDLLDSARAQREALRRANPKDVSEASDRHARAIGTLAGLEQTRLDLVRRLSPGLASTNPRGAATLRDLAQRFDPATRDRLLERIARVREVTIEAQRACASLRIAAATLAGHMEGLARQIARRLSHAGTYSERGVVGAGTVVVSGIDLKS